MVKRGAWLSVTPEPERELPLAAATLRAGGRPDRSAVQAEESRIEHLLLHGSQRRWISYLHEVAKLIDTRAANPDAEVRRQRARAIKVLANHHNLLLGLPGRGARWTQSDRARLDRAAATATTIERGHV
ncbi:MAG TPA: hypothetical protein VG405_10755 [Solirubrobacteraceae bacterium]|nr:hypothetical protein [Solirubrobacteraceae bacterium]